MSTKQNKALEHRYLELWRNKGDVNLISEFLTSDFVWHGPGWAEAKGIEGMKQVLIGFLASYSDDLQVTVEDMVAEGDMVMYRYTICGTYMGRPAPSGGKKVTMMGFMQDRFKDGKIAETWELINMLGFFQQLGVEPPRR